jgi:hypothetical protein
MRNADETDAADKNVKKLMCTYLSIILVIFRLMLEMKIPLQSHKTKILLKSLKVGHREIEVEEFKSDKGLWIYSKPAASK